MKKQIIDKIEENQTSTTEILDLFGKDWSYFMNIPPLTEGSYAVGEAYVVHIIEDANWYIHEDIRSMPENRIVFIENHNSNRAAFGSLVSDYLFNHREVKAVVSKGNLRDGQTLKEKRDPIWCKDIVAVGCFNKRTEYGHQEHLKLKKRGHKFDGAIFVCDDCGIAVIPKEEQTPEFLEKLDFIQTQEAKWFECIEKGWTTYKTVCLKEYLKESK